MLIKIHELLKPGGKVIIGDIPFADLFKVGKRDILTVIMQLIYVKYREKEVLTTAQRIGFRAKIVAQPAELLFADTRKDLILEKIETGP
jgi:hypothetical protein